MTPILMRHDTDCEVAALATACEVSYEEARKALGWKKLPLGAENPVFGNPINLYRALINLGFWKHNIRFRDLAKGRATPNKTVVLIHNKANPILQQHWVVWAGLDANKNHLLWWGINDKTLVAVPSQTMSEYFYKGFPNCAFTVYKASLLRVVWQKIRRIFGFERT